MALLVWEDVTWPDFVAGLEGFRDHFTRAARAPDAFPENAADIIRLLNRWACRLSTERAPGALETWLEDNAAALEKLAPLTISDPRLPAHAEELGAMHDDLIAHMRANGVNSMGDAAASKALYVLRPRLFVMWDKEIRRSAPEGYGAYLLQMHALAAPPHRRGARGRRRGLPPGAARLRDAEDARQVPGRVQLVRGGRARAAHPADRLISMNSHSAPFVQCMYTRPRAKPARS